MNGIRVGMVLAILGGGCDGGGGETLTLCVEGVNAPGGFYERCSEGACPPLGGDILYASTVSDDSCAARGYDREGAECPRQDPDYAYDAEGCAIDGGGGSCSLGPACELSTGNFTDADGDLNTFQYCAVDYTEAECNDRFGVHWSEPCDFFGFEYPCSDGNYYRDPDACRLLGLSRVSSARDGCGGTSDSGGATGATAGTGGAAAGAGGTTAGMEGGGTTGDCAPDDGIFATAPFDNPAITGTNTGVLEVADGIPVSLCTVFEGENSIGPCLTARRYPVVVDGSTMTVQYPEDFNGNRFCVGPLTPAEFDEFEVSWNGCGDQASLTYPGGNVDAYTRGAATAGQISACGL